MNPEQASKIRFAFDDKGKDILEIDASEYQEFHEQTTLSNMADIVDDYGVLFVLKELQKYCCAKESQVLHELLKLAAKHEFGKGVKL